MKKASQMWAKGKAEESTKTDDATYFHHIVKPLLNGCLTGQLHGLVWYWYTQAWTDSNISHKTLLRKELLFGVTHTTASLGIFEILTKKLETTNNGRPLALYQEACCGLTSGATAALVWQPFVVAQNRVGSQNLSYRNWFSTLFHIVRNEGVLTLWRGSGWNVGSRAVTNMGMLASYNHSLSYLRDSQSLSERNAHLSASIISGFFGAACGHPCQYIKEIKNAVQKQYHGGKKHAYRNIPPYISQILTPRSGFNFYVGFLNSLHQCALFCVVQWAIFEEIRRLVDSKCKHV